MYSTSFTNIDHDVTTVEVLWNSLKYKKLNISEQNMIFPGNKINFKLFPKNYIIRNHRFFSEGNLK